MSLKLCLLGLGSSILWTATSLAAQSDTTGSSSPPAPPEYRLDDVAIVAHRTPTLLRQGVSAATVVSREELESLPVRTLADALLLVPGLVFLERDGAGQLPMAVARGFFGGGETEYVQLMLDGVPVNDLRTGTIEWTQLPIGSIERIEVQRGAGSATYGDAALGGVVNVVSRDPPSRGRLSARAEAGAWGGWQVQAAGGGPAGQGALHGDFAAATLDGYRAHAGSTDLSASLAYRQLPESALQLRARAFARRIEKDEPGALPREEAERDPRGANPFFDADRRRRHMGDLSAGLTSRPSESSRVEVDASLRLVDEDAIRTLLLTPGFADTQRSEESNWSLWSRLEAGFGFGSTSVVTGVETAYGEYETAYFEPGIGGTELGAGGGARMTLGLYAEVRQPIASRWTAFLGGRYDHLTLDRHGERATPAATFSRFSPRLGVNFAYMESDGATGNAYVSWSRSFKAPTLEQLYGARRIPTGAPGETISFSNDALRPQSARGIEAGVHQRLPLGPGHAEVSLSAYRLDVDDEIDFDLATFRFGNIVESRHEGFEAALSATPVRPVTLRHSLNLARVNFRSGESGGNQLKNIPRAATATVLTLSLREPLRISLIHRFVGALYLDDANRETIPGHHTVALKVGWRVRSIGVELTGDNLLDTRASSLGFTLFDPAGGGQVPFVYPIAGRSLRFALALEP